MGSITSDVSVQENINFPPEDQFEIDDEFKHFDISGLADRDSAAQTIKYDVVLLCWLLASWRMSPTDDVEVRWAYHTKENSSRHERLFHIVSIREILPELQSNVKSAVRAVAGHMARCVFEQGEKRSDALSLLLRGELSSDTSLDGSDEATFDLEVCFDNGLLAIRLDRGVHRKLGYATRRHIKAWVDIIKQCILNPETLVFEVLKPTAGDLDEIWHWNHVLPPTYSLCMHDIITQRAHKTPEDEAISSWDGILTYHQVDEYSSHVACMLKAMGVQVNSVVPVCFEKSKWTSIAVLGVMKAGATFLLLDPTIPLLRLQDMVKQVGARTIVTSQTQHELSESLSEGIQLLDVSTEMFNLSSNLQLDVNLPIVDPSTLMYIIFTSGSTGTPKGVMISHETYTSSAIPRAEAVGYSQNSRVLDFASYAFDVSIDSMLCTLSQGGCLCIPSDEDRLNDLNQVIRSMRVTYAGLTPSVARILDQNVLSSMESLGLGGEAVTARNVAHWGQSTRIVIGYGPCECTIGCTINSSAARGRNYVSMGKGNGAVIWIVNPEDPSLLSPVGAVGELWVEGPIVGQGYLNDPTKTAASFEQDPPWLIAGHKKYAGRRGRLYKTGDLVRYDPDGLGGIVFVGRKDTQVKLRGQRIELGEIEWQLKNILPKDVGVIAEVIPASDDDHQPILVAFISSKYGQPHESTTLEVVSPSDELSEALSHVSVKLAKIVPRYMVPAMYICVSYIPVLISGKIGRKNLRQFGSSVDLRKLRQHVQPESGRPLTTKEDLLRESWHKALRLKKDDIAPDDNFFTLGGDSIAAMKLVSLIRQSGFGITVTCIFLHPTLAAMAAVLQTQQVRSDVDIPAFSMTSCSPENALTEAVKACKVEVAAIEDIYPCTPTQQSLFTFSMKSIKPYIAQRIFSIPSHISIKLWKQAWEDAIAATPILRVRIYRPQDSGLEQVQLKENILWKTSSCLAKYLEADQLDNMDLGQSLARYAIVDETSQKQRFMVWTIHHVLYDGWSEPRLLHKVYQALKGERLRPQPQLKSFVNFLRQVDGATVKEFWRNELQGAVGAQFPQLPSRHYVPSPDAILEHQIAIQDIPDTPFTLATILRGAWALVASQYTSSDDVVFCETFTGRDIPLEGVEDIEGPLIATTPVRIRINRNSTVQSYLQDVQRNILSRVSYQHYGMQNIRKTSRDAEYACEARTGLVIQTDSGNVCAGLGLQEKDALRESLHFNPYPLMLACGISTKAIRVCASFDSSLIPIPEVERLLTQIETAFLQLSNCLSKPVGTISCLSAGELDQIWQMNSVGPISSETISSTIKASACVKQGSIYPPLAVGWVCDPREPSRLSPLGCVGELWLEGAFADSNTSNCPAWLIAGSSSHQGRKGRVQATGDLVKLQGNGNLIFIGRSPRLLPTKDQTLDMYDLELQLSNHLRPGLKIAAALYGSSNEHLGQYSHSNLILLLEQQAVEARTIDILPNDYSISLEGVTDEEFQLKVCAKLSISLLEELKSLHKFAEDTLRPNMIPYTYLVIEKMPEPGLQNEREYISRLIKEIPLSVITQVRENLHAAWITRSQSASLTPAEDILLLAWAEVLKMKPEHIELDDNFFRLGGDSILAMKLVSNLRTQGHAITVADLFRYTRLSDIAKVMKFELISDIAHQHYTPFSLINTTEHENFRSRIIQPLLANKDWAIKDILPVTDSQVLDIRASIHVPRTSMQYNMLYFDNSIDQQRLVHACEKMVQTHDILRTVFVEHESSFLQVILDKLDLPLTIQEASGDLEAHVRTTCAQDIESPRRLGSPFLQMFLIKAQSGESCLVITLSHAQYDGISLPKLLYDLESLYTRNETITYEPFTSYMAHIRAPAAQEKAIAYWRKLLQGSTPSTLEEHPNEMTARSLFVSKPVEVSSWPKEITMASLLASAWALVLAQHLQSTDIVFGGITSGRQVNMASIENIMGPCYQFTPVRVSFNSSWTGLDLMHLVQNQTAESAAYDYLGFKTIAQRCTEWPASHTFFDSIVHHQDFEDFDTMPFADGSCRVDIMNPHGDAATPLKAVSFMRDGKVHAGVVGSEKSAEFVNAMLDKLLGALDQLATSPTDILVNTRYK